VAFAVKIVTFIVVGILVCAVLLTLLCPPAWVGVMNRAIKSGNSAMVSFLLWPPGAEKPVNYSFRIADMSGFTPLEAACLYGTPDMVALLVERGGEVNPDGGWPPLIYACASDNPHKNEIIRTLVAAGADINAETSDGHSPLGCAMWGKINTDGSLGNRPAEETDEDATYETFLVMEELGADLSGATFFAATNDNVKILQYLDERGLLSLDDDESGDEKTYLMMTAIFDAPRAAEFLLEKGVDKTVKDKDGKTAYDYAVEYGHEDVAVILKEGA
jgi:hypothetical protein